MNLAFRVPQIFKVASTLHFCLSYSCKVYSQSLASLDNYLTRVYLWNNGSHFGVLTASSIPHRSK